MRLCDFFFQALNNWALVSVVLIVRSQLYLVILFQALLGYQVWVMLWLTPMVCSLVLLFQALKHWSQGKRVVLILKSLKLMCLL